MAVNEWQWVNCLKANIVRLLFYKVKSSASPNDTNILKVQEEENDELCKQQLKKKHIEYTKEKTDFMRSILLGI